MVGQKKWFICGGLAWRFGRCPKHGASNLHAFSNPFFVVVEVARRKGAAPPPDLFKTGCKYLRTEVEWRAFLCILRGGRLYCGWNSVTCLWGLEMWSRSTNVFECAPMLVRAWQQWGARGGCGPWAAWPVHRSQLAIHFAAVKRKKGYGSNGSEKFGGLWAKHTETDTLTPKAKAP